MQPLVSSFPRCLISELDRIARDLEMAAGGEALVSVLLASPDGTSLTHAVAPSLPEPFVWAINGLEIAQGSGVCGSAAFLGHPIYVADVLSDPMCEAYHEIAGDHGLRACWSVPFFDSGARLLGTVACYFRRPRAPGNRERALVSAAAEALAKVVQAAGEI